MVSNSMLFGRLSLSLALTCGFGLFSAGCLSNKNDEVSAEAAPPPSTYSIALPGYVGTAAAPAPIVAYNMFMGSVDIMDQKRASTAVKRKEKHLSTCIFYH